MKRPSPRRKRRPGRKDKKITTERTQNFYSLFVFCQCSLCVRWSNVFNSSILTTEYTEHTEENGNSSCISWLISFSKKLFWTDVKEDIKKLSEFIDKDKARGYLLKTEKVLQWFTQKMKF